MTQQHPELADEQAYVDHAYECLERTTAVGVAAARPQRGRPRRHVPGPLRAQRLRRGPGQAARPTSTSATPRSSSGASTATPRARTATESFHIGRLAVADEQSEPIVVDWRAPVAEPFYRATGREPMGLVRRRHFAVEGRTRARHRGRAVRRRPPRRRPRRRPRAGRPATRRSCAATRRCSPPSSGAAPARSATSSPRSRPSRTRSSARRRPACSSSRAGRAPARPSSPCTAPPTCCTPTASRSRTRACSSSGPNRVFLRYIERVLPSLGEAGVEQVVLADLVPDVRFARPGRSRRLPLDRAGQGRRPHVATSSTRPSRDRERPLRDDLRVPFRTGYVRLTRRASRRASSRPPGAASAATTAAAASSRARSSPRWRRRGAGEPVTAGEVRQARAPAARGPGRARADVAGADAGPAAPRPVRLAGPAAPGRRRRARPTTRSRRSHRPRSDDVDDVRWTPADVALLDDAREVLGPRARQGRQGRRRPTRSARTATSSSTRSRTSRRCS